MNLERIFGLGGQAVLVAMSLWFGSGHIKRPRDFGLGSHLSNQ